MSRQPDAVEGRELSIPVGGVDDSPRGSVAPRCVVGTVNYHADDELELCLSSIRRQTVGPTRVLVLDNDGEAQGQERLLARNPDVLWTRQENHGFAAAANSILTFSQKPDVRADYCLLRNPDVEMEPDFLENLLKQMMRCRNAALASGKLVRSDTGVIDSAGIALPRYRRPRDRGSGAPDHGQYERTEFVFGAERR